jgi:hypothetical protein
MIKDHVVMWNSGFATKAVLLIGKDGILIPCILCLNIKKVFPLPDKICDQFVLLD